MVFDKNRLYRNLFLTFSCINLVLYIIFHLVNFVFYSYISTDFAYAATYIAEIAYSSVTFMIPIIAAAALLPLIMTAKLYRAIPAALLMSAGSCFYNLPYYYLEYVISYQYDSLEAILFGALSTAASVLVGAIYTLVLAALAWVIVKRRGGGLHSIAKRLPYFDFSREAVLAVFAISSVQFVLRLVKEIISTVTYIIDYVNSYRIDEVITIVLSYILLLVLLLTCQSVTVFYINKSLSKRITDE